MVIVPVGDEHGFDGELLLQRQGCGEAPGIDSQPVVDKDRHEADVAALALVRPQYLYTHTAQHIPGKVPLRPKSRGCLDYTMRGGGSRTASVAGGFSTACDTSKGSKLSASDTAAVALPPSGTA